jgi:hypothetical protein
VVSDTPTKSRGYKRMKEIAAEVVAEREALTAELLAALGRPATVIDRIACENLAALHVRAKRIEASGRNASDVRRQITQLMRGVGIKPDAPASKPQRKIDPLEYARTFGRTDEAAR